MKSIPISSTNSTIITRIEKISPVSNPTYSLVFSDLNNFELITTTGIDISTSKLQYNEFLINNEELGLGSGQYYLDFTIQGVSGSIYRTIIEIENNVVWEVDDSLPTYTYDS